MLAVSLIFYFYFFQALKKKEIKIKQCKKVDFTMYSEPDAWSEKESISFGATLQQIHNKKELEDEMEHFSPQDETTNPLKAIRLLVNLISSEKVKQKKKKRRISISVDDTCISLYIDVCLD